MSIPVSSAITDSQRKRGQPKIVEVVRLVEILWRQGKFPNRMSAAEKRQIQYDYRRKLLLNGYFVLTKNNVNAIAIKVCTNIGVYIELPEGQPPLSQDSLLDRTVFKRGVEQEINKMANLRSNRMQNLLSKYDLNDREIIVQNTADREQVVALISAVIEREMVYLAKSATYYAMEREIKNRTGNTAIEIDGACLQKVIDHPINLEEKNTETSRLFYGYLREMFSFDHYDGKRKVVYSKKEKAGEIIFQFLELMVHTVAIATLEKRYELIVARANQSANFPNLPLEEEWKETKRYVLNKVQGARYTAEMAKIPEFGASEEEKKEAAKIVVSDVNSQEKDVKCQSRSEVSDASFLQPAKAPENVEARITSPQTSTPKAVKPKIKKRKIEKLLMTEQANTPNSSSDMPLPPKYKRIIKKPKPKPSSSTIPNSSTDTFISAFVKQFIEEFKSQAPDLLQSLSAACADASTASSSPSDDVFRQLMMNAFARTVILNPAPNQWFIGAMVNSKAVQSALGPTPARLGKSQVTGKAPGVGKAHGVGIFAGVGKSPKADKFQAMTASPLPGKSSSSLLGGACRLLSPATFKSEPAEEEDEDEEEEFETEYYE